MAAILFRLSLANNKRHDSKYGPMRYYPMFLNAFFLFLKSKISKVEASWYIMIIFPSTKETPVLKHLIFILICLLMHCISTAKWKTGFSSVLTMEIRQSHVEPLTHWGRDKMTAVYQTTFSNAFSWMKIGEFRLRFHWSLFLWFQLTISQHWFR